MKIVVCDTGPILHLREADCLSILQAAGSILIPPAVDAEMARLDRHWGDKRPAWIQTTSLDPAHLDDARSWLQAGDELADLACQEPQELAERVGTGDPEQVARIAQDECFQEIVEQGLRGFGQPHRRIAAEDEMAREALLPQPIADDFWPVRQVQAHFGEGKGQQTGAGGAAGSSAR